MDLHASSWGDCGNAILSPSILYLISCRVYPSKSDEGEKDQFHIAYKHHSIEQNIKNMQPSIVSHKAPPLGSWCEGNHCGTESCEEIKRKSGGQCLVPFLGAHVQILEYQCEITPYMYIYNISTKASKSLAIYVGVLQPMLEMFFETWLPNIVAMRAHTQAPNTQMLQREEMCDLFCQNHGKNCEAYNLVQSLDL